MVATSYCPPWLATSCVTLSRSSFSGRIVNLTVMPVCLVKLSAVSFWMSSICGLPTISAVMVLSAESPPPVEPAPEHPERTSAPAVAPAINNENFFPVFCTADPPIEDMHHRAGQAPGEKNCDERNQT